jgi:hypothetical protein
MRHNPQDALSLSESTTTKKLGPAKTLLLSSRVRVNLLWPNLTLFVAHLIPLSWAHPLSHTLDPKASLAYSILQFNPPIAQDDNLQPCPNLASLTDMSHACMHSRPPIFHDFSIYQTVIRSILSGSSAVDIRNLNQTPFLLFFQLPVFVMPNTPSSTLLLMLKIRAP